MWEILTFRRMITPSLLQWIFWLLIVVFIMIGIADLLHHRPLFALFWLILAPLCLRVLIELVICLFAINNQLNDVRKNVELLSITPKKE
jgi:hypothetical protein